MKSEVSLKEEIVLLSQDDKQKKTLLPQDTGKQQN